MISRTCRLIVFIAAGSAAACATTRRMSVFRPRGFYNNAVHRFFPDLDQRAAVKHRARARGARRARPAVAEPRAGDPEPRGQGCGREPRLVVTGTYRAWRHFVAVRATEHADVEIRRLAIECLRQLIDVAPQVFSDFEISTLADGSEVATSPLATEA